MKVSRVLLFCFVLVCLVLAISAPLSAQEPGPPVSLSVPQPSLTPKQATPSSAQKLARQCREFLPASNDSQTVTLKMPSGKLWDCPRKDLARAKSKGGVVVGISVAWQSRFEAADDDELDSAVKRARECVTLPNARIRLAAFDAYGVLLDEQWVRTSRFVDTTWGKLMAEQKEKQQEEREKYEAELNKQRADFAEVANFAATLYKQREQYHDEEFKVLRAYVELQDRYRETYELAVEAINLAGNRLSLPAFVSVPAPQVIRIETPPIPRSLHCTSNTMPQLAPGLSTWTWTDCHW